MFVKILFLSLIIVAAAVIFLGVKIFFTSKGRFPEYHVGSNPEMRRRGITCAKKTDIGYPSSGSNGCTACRQGIS